MPLNGVNFTGGLPNTQWRNQALQGDFAKELVNVCNTSQSPLKSGILSENTFQKYMPNTALKTSHELVLELKAEAMRDVPKDINKKIETAASSEVKEKIYEFMVLVKQLKDHIPVNDINALTKLGGVEKDFLSFVKNHRLDDKSPLGRDESVSGVNKFKNIKSSLFQMLPKDNFALGNQIMKNKIEPLISDYEKKNPRLAVSLRETVELVQGQRRVNAEEGKVSADPLLNNVLDLKLVSKILDLVQEKIVEQPDTRQGSQNIKTPQSLPVHTASEVQSNPNNPALGSGMANNIIKVGGAVTHVNVDLSALKESLDNMNKTTDKLVDFLIQEQGLKGATDPINTSNLQDLFDDVKDLKLKTAPVNMCAEKGELRMNETLSTAIQGTSTYPGPYDTTDKSPSQSQSNIGQAVQPGNEAKNLSPAPYVLEMQSFGDFAKLSSARFSGHKLADAPRQSQGKTEKSLQLPSEEKAYEAEKLSPVSYARESKLFGDFARPSELRDAANKLKNKSPRQSQVQERTNKPSPQQLQGNTEKSLQRPSEEKTYEAEKLPSVSYAREMKLFGDFARPSELRDAANKLKNRSPGQSQAQEQVGKTSPAAAGEENNGVRSMSSNYYIGSQGSAQAPSAFSSPRDFSSPQQFFQENYFKKGKD